MGNWVHEDFFIDLDESADETDFDNLSAEMTQIEKLARKNQAQGGENRSQLNHSKPNVDNLTDRAASPREVSIEMARSRRSPSSHGDGSDDDRDGQGDLDKNN